MVEHDYLLRGKCYQLVCELVERDVTLTIVRGWYHCPYWGRQQHWWAQRADGTIVDPTAAQFPSVGMGEYEPYAGMVQCEQCERQIAEGVAYIDPPHVFCSYECYGRCVIG